MGLALQPIFQFADVLMADAVGARQRASGPTPTARQRLTDCLDLFVRKLAAAVSLSARHDAPTFIVHVPDVVRDASEKQMAGVNAFPIVAAMTDIATAWDSALGQFVGQPWRFPVAAINAARTNFQESVAVLVATCGPFPALLRAALVDLFPEPQTPVAWLRTQFHYPIIQGAMSCR